MSIAAAKRPISPEELLAMPDAHAFELVDGELVERSVSVLSSWVEGLLLAILAAYARKHDVGQVFPSSLGLRCFPFDPQRVRRADVSFVRKERLTAELIGEGYLTLAPDIAVEVVSPNDLAYEVDEKVEEYMKAGVQLIWVVHPETRSVTIHRADGSTTRLREGDRISGESVLPGFDCPLTDLFPPRPA